MSYRKYQLYIGIVGCGLIADIHAEAIAAAQNCQLVAAYSRSQEKAEDFGKKYHITGYTDWDAFIANPEMDAVSICTAKQVSLAVIYQNRFYADIMTAHKKLQEKYLGDIFLAVYESVNLKKTISINSLY